MYRTNNYFIRRLIPTRSDKMKYFIVELICYWYRSNSSPCYQRWNNSVISSNNYEERRRLDALRYRTRYKILSNIFASTKMRTIYWKDLARKKLILSGRKAPVNWFNEFIKTPLCNNIGIKFSNYNGSYCILLIFLPNEFFSFRVKKSYNI